MRKKWDFKFRHDGWTNLRRSHILDHEREKKWESTNWPQSLQSALWTRYVTTQQLCSWILQLIVGQIKLPQMRGVWFQSRDKWSTSALWQSTRDQPKWRNNIFRKSCSNFKQCFRNSRLVVFEKVLSERCLTSESPVCSVDPSENHKAVWQLDPAACCCSAPALSDGLGWISELMPERRSSSQTNCSPLIWVERIKWVDR